MKINKKDFDFVSINKLIKVLLFVTVIGAILLATYVFKEWNIFSGIKTFFSVISPLIIGFIIAWLFEPAATFLEKKKLPRIIACLIPYIAFWGVLILAITLIAPSFIDQVISFAETIPALAEEALKTATSFTNTLNLNEVVNIKEQFSGALGGIISTLSTTLPNLLISIGSSAVGIGFTLFLSIIIGFYLLYDFKKANNAIMAFVPNKWQNNAKELGQRINTSLRSYVQGVLIIMVLIFVFQSIGYTLSGLESPLVFAVFGAVTNVIPYFGPYIGGIPAVIVGFTINPLVGIFVLVTILVVQLLDNVFFSPLVMGHAVKLHPVTIIISLLIFQQLFGIIGMIVATPIVASIKVIFNFTNERFNIKEKIVNN